MVDRMLLHVHYFSVWPTLLLGDGHFSPVGGYHPGKDLILILDTARFKYPPHWISLELLWEAMHALDNSTGKHSMQYTLHIGYI